MEFLKVENNYLILRIELMECKSCHKPMIKSYEQNLNFLDFKLRTAGITKESYNDSGICRDCIKKGGFPRGCECCHQYKEFPKEFKYKLTRYAKYPEDETEFLYICNDCVRLKPQDILFLATSYDEFEEIK